MPSPRNSKVAHVDLLRRLKCETLITTSPEPPCVPPILQDFSLQKIVIPSLLDLLENDDVPHYAYGKSFAEARNDPIFILHTSGSTGEDSYGSLEMTMIVNIVPTGIPKPLVYTNECSHRIMNALHLSPPDGHISLPEKLQRGSFFTMLPAFHVRPSLVSEKNLEQTG